MIFTTFLLFFMQGGEGRPQPGTGAPPVLQFRSRVIIRIPSIAPPPRAPRAPPQPLEWRESKGPRCVSPRMLRGFAISHEDSIDMVLRDGLRIRARLDSDCSSLDFRSGIYLHPGPDGLICEDRDSIHTRAGGECEIERFRALSLKR